MSLQRTTSNFLALCVLAVGTSAFAASMNWGDLDDAAGDVMFLQVTEDNDELTLLFGTPTVTGNQIQFDPQNFQSQSSGGAANLIDSTATTTIMAKPNEVINNIQFTETGDYTLSGLTGGQAQATVGAAFFITVEEVDNLPVTLPTQSENMVFTTGSGVNGGEYNRPGDDGTAVIWDGTFFFDVDAYLASESIDGSATKVRVRFDNTLSTAADAVSNAFIKKKEIGGVIITTNIPEPASAVLLLALTAVGLSGRRRS